MVSMGSVYIFRRRKENDGRSHCGVRPARQCGHVPCKHMEASRPPWEWVGGKLLYVLFFLSLDLGLNI